MHRRRMHDELNRLSCQPAQLGVTLCRAMPSIRLDPVRPCAGTPSLCLINKTFRLLDMRLF